MNSVFLHYIFKHQCINYLSYDFKKIRGQLRKIVQKIYNLKNDYTISNNVEPINTVSLYNFEECECCKTFAYLTHTLCDKNNNKIRICSNCGTLFIILPDNNETFKINELSDISTKDIIKELTKRRISNNLRDDLIDILDLDISDFDIRDLTTNDLIEELETRNLSCAKTYNIRNIKNWLKDDDEDNRFISNNMIECMKYDVFITNIDKKSLEDIEEFFK